MGLGDHAYGHDLVERTGAVNVLRGRPRYPKVSPAELQLLRPDIILLPDEPYRFGEVDLEQFAGVAPARLVDGKLLWWYGPRIPAAIRELRRLFADVGRP
jgi:ABC-type hemin transport system substrate-binding protein